MTTKFRCVNGTGSNVLFYIDTVDKTVVSDTTESIGFTSGGALTVKGGMSVAMTSRLNNIVSNTVSSTNISSTNLISLNQTSGNLIGTNITCGNYASPTTFMHTCGIASGTWMESFSVYSPNATNGNTITSKVGKNGNDAGFGYFGLQYYSDSNTGNNLTFGLCGHDNLLKIYPNGTASCGSFNCINITSGNAFVSNGNILNGSIGNLIGTNITCGDLIVNSTTDIRTTSNYSTSSGSINVINEAVFGKSILFPSISFAPPSAGNRSIGTRIVLHPDLDNGYDYALGIENVNMWFSVPLLTSGYKFYQGTNASFIIGQNGIMSCGNMSLTNISSNTVSLANNTSGITWYNNTARIYNDSDFHITTDDRMYFDIAGNNKLFLDGSNFKINPDVSAGNIRVGAITSSNVITTNITCGSYRSPSSFYKTCDLPQSTWIEAFTNYAPNASNGSIIMDILGANGGNSNYGYMGFQYYSSGDSRNNLTFGLAGYDSLLNIYRDGNVSCGSFNCANETTVNLLGSYITTGDILVTSTTDIGTRSSFSITSGAINIQNEAVFGKSILFPASGIAPPTYGRTAGTKIVLYPDNNLDYGMGIETNNIWFGVPTMATGFKFYQNTTATFVIGQNGVVSCGSMTVTDRSTFGNAMINTNLYFKNLTSRIYDNGQLHISTDDRFYIDTTDGNKVFINSTSAGFSVPIICNGMLVLDSTGNLTVNGDITSFGGLSDIRLKEDIVPLEYNDEILKLNPVEFKWKENVFNVEKRGKSDVGFIAQELNEVIPKATGVYKSVDGEEYMNIEVSRIIPYIVKTIQNIDKRIKCIENKLGM